jgi:high-affinity nickel-transport protein
VPGRWLGGLSRSERRHLGGMATAIVALHLVGWATLVAIVVPQHLTLGAKAFGLGIGLTAYVLGMRHAFDADHIAAIDNTTRRMLESGRRPLSVGFWFSLGHSSVVFGLAVLVALGARSLPGTIADAHSGPGMTFVLVGTAVSAGFLFLVASLNLASFVKLLRLFRGMRGGRVDERHVDAALQGRGVMGRLAARGGRVADRPGRMYLVGLLFGLGFDTATEIVLLVIAGASAASGVPWYAVLCIPVIFAAGMSLVDTIDGSFMAMAYGWALAQPVRKVYVNLAMTGLSVTAAVAVGTCEVLAFAGDRLGLDRGWWSWTEAIDSSSIGMVIAALLALTWAVALVIWRWGRIEEKWTAADGG